MIKNGFLVLDATAEQNQTIHSISVDEWMPLPGLQVVLETNNKVPVRRLNISDLAVGLHVAFHEDTRQIIFYDQQASIFILADEIVETKILSLGDMREGFYTSLTLSYGTVLKGYSHITFAYSSDSEKLLQILKTKIDMWINEF